MVGVRIQGTEGDGSWLIQAPATPAHAVNRRAVEGPIWGDDGKIIKWSAWNAWRKYPVDNGAFAFNATLLGSDLPGPAFWPTDTE